jgi:hypothetical protein
MKNDIVSVGATWDMVSLTASLSVGPVRIFGTKIAERLARGPCGSVSYALRVFTGKMPNWMVSIAN